MNHPPVSNEDHRLAARWWLLLMAALMFRLAPAAAETVQADPQPAEINRLRVLVASRLQTTLASRIDSHILRLTVDQGQRFEKGALLVDLDCEIFQAQQQKARMELEAEEQTHRANLRLLEYRSIGELEVALSAAKVKRAEAALQVVAAQSRRCRVTAPFSGRVVKRLAQPHQYVASGDPLLEILDDAQLRLELFVPSRWIPRLKIGTRFQVRIDETGRHHEARITRLGARVDPVSQTLEVHAGIEESAADKGASLLPGMSGSAFFPGFE